MVSYSSAQAAVDMFLKIEGVDGESTDNQYPDWIEVLAFSEGMSQSGSFSTGAGGGAGKVNVQDLSVTKYLDRSSPFIRQKLAEGAVIPNATLVIRKGGANPLVFFTIELEKVILSSVSTGGSGAEDRLTENITLNFARIKWTYIPEKADGTGGAALPAGWDLETNTKF
jgi:type VI secretion system secreted protein Hcp